MTSVWVLTREINEYGQDGEYFVKVFASAPSAAQLMEAGVPQTSLHHVMNGGGRKEWENEWYWLRENEL